MGWGCQGRRGRQRIRSPFVMDCGMSNIDRMRDEQLKNEKDEAERLVFFSIVRPAHVIGYLVSTMVKYNGKCPSRDEKMR